MWRATRKWGTGEIVCDNVKDKNWQNGILFLPGSFYKVCFCFLFFVAGFVCLCCVLACVHAGVSLLLANTQDRGSLHLLCINQQGRPQSPTYTHTHTHTHTHPPQFSRVSFTSSPLWHPPVCVGCLCASQCRCVFVFARWLVCEVRLNTRLAMRGGNWGGTGRISHTYTHTHTYRQWQQKQHYQSNM